MKSIFLLLLLFISVSTGMFGQDIYYTKNGLISFYSKAPLEDIEARNNEVSSFIDIKKSEVAFSVLIKSFRFEKALMEEHFNESYLESDKYPKATFTGKVKNPEVVKRGVNGSYQVTVEGTLTIHNVSKPLSIVATVTIKGDNLSGKAKFNVRLADFNVKIPSVVSKNIAEVVEVTVDCQYLPFVKK